MQIIAYGLEKENPVAYMLLFLIMYPPIMIIMFALWDKVKEWVHKDD